MQRILTGPLRHGFTHDAETIKTTLSKLGWTHLSTSYSPQERSAPVALKASTFAFQWAKSEKPAYPTGIAYQVL